MFTATILSSLLAATVLAAPAPQQEFNSYDEFRQLLLAEPGRHMEEIDGMYVLLDGANATIATAGPKYNWAMHTAIDEKQCLQYSKVLMLPNNTLSKPMNDAVHEKEESQVASAVERMRLARGRLTDTQSLASQCSSRPHTVDRTSGPQVGSKRAWIPQRWYPSQTQESAPCPGIEQTDTLLPGLWVTHTSGPKSRAAGHMHTLPCLSCTHTCSRPKTNSGNHWAEGMVQTTSGPPCGNFVVGAEACRRSAIFAARPPTLRPPVPIFQEAALPALPALLARSLVIVRDEASRAASSEFLN
ncbi:hypothetical protein A1Q2_03376 [Trichosporon asahii var. asahii CBS 8904]|uniref:Uncharacterized protein n=1 Tax=Trichosporon asahii var. asahii (strain CBS 8904) TaxID=1220162 RepID=K1VE91_TRIAC|nr:hypothetical protein A1Q2_03376 [Trichosporon asahii var. asahii CBS 8904]